MSYQTYTTEGYVCGSYDRNTSDKYYFIFTQDAGMVIANAKSVRDEKSKLRFALQDFTHLQVSIVRGRHGWRITGALPLSNFYFDAHDREVRASLLRVTALLRRFVQGEDPHTLLFTYVMDGLQVLKEGVSDPDICEKVLVLKILHELGYVAPHESLKEIMESGGVGAACKVVIERPHTLSKIDRSIEEALSVSHL